MARNLTDDIAVFIGYFEKQIAEIRGLQAEHKELYRQILYMAVLDALSKSVMPERDKNRERFIYFLQRFCDWPDGDRVSLAHLVRLLQRNPDPAFESLRKWALEQFKAMPVHGGALMSIAKDPKVEDVKKRWPTSGEHKMPIEGVDLDALTHYRLLYVYRNMLVHEMRTPGRGMDFKEGDEPYYHLASNVDRDFKLVGESVELVYPWQFLHHLCETAIGRLRDYFTEDALNPYESFVWGTYWIRELNK